MQRYGNFQKISQKFPKKFFWDKQIFGFRFGFWGKVGLYLGKKNIVFWGEEKHCLLGGRKTLSFKRKILSLGNKKTLFLGNKKTLFFKRKTLSLGNKKTLFFKRKTLSLGGKRS